MTEPLGQTDGELVRAARAGQAAAFPELVRRYARRVAALCHAQVRRPDVADDLAQETLLRGWRALNSLADPGKFGPWLRGIARRVCLDWLKARPRAAVPFSTLAPGTEFAAKNGHCRLEAAEARGQLWAAINQLPDDCRETLLLYYYDDVTYQDLAELLDVSAATINARLTRARQLLRARLSPQEVGHELR